MKGDGLFTIPSPDANARDACSTVTCPFCSLLCDDLPLESLRDDSAGRCPRAAQSLLTVLSETSAQAGPLIKGQPASLSTALESAAALLRDAARPLLAATASDVAGTRAALALAEACNGIVDHVHGDATGRNLEVLQGSGWMSVNLGELRNRTDLVVILDADVLCRHPRLLQRFIQPADPQGIVLEREIITVGGAAAAGIEHLSVPLSALADVLAELRCLIADLPLPQNDGVDRQTLSSLAQRMRKARYGALIWSTQSFDFEHGDLVAQMAADLVSDLNQHGRFTCLPLAASDGAATLQQVATWTCGFPLRIGFSAGMPVYDPYHFAAHRVLARREADLLLWLASFDARQAPPGTDIPQIVLARPDNPARTTADVFIPVGVPGIDHAGYQFRGDSVAVLPLGKTRDIGLPAAAHILHALRERSLETGALETPC